MKITREKKENAGTGLWKYVDWVWRFLTGRPHRYITIELKGDKNDS